MQKVVKEKYDEIINDLQPLFDKWGVQVISGAMWRFQRTRSKLQELKDEKIRIEKELQSYEKTT